MSLTTDFSIKSSALAKFETLKKNGYFSKPSDVTAVEKLFEVDEDKATTQKTDMSAWNTLNELDENDQLTRPLILAQKDSLSTSDFKHFLQKNFFLPMYIRRSEILL